MSESFALDIDMKDDGKEQLSENAKMFVYKLNEHKKLFEDDHNAFYDAMRRYKP